MRCALKEYIHWLFERDDFMTYSFRSITMHKGIPISLKRPASLRRLFQNEYEFKSRLSKSFDLDSNKMSKPD